MAVDVDPSVLDNLDRQYQHSIDLVIANLQHTCERLMVMKQVRQNFRDMLPNYLGGSEDVLHEFQSMLGNARLEQVVRAARDAHDYARGRDLS